MKKTKKTGVYYNELDNGDKVFYFTYKDINDLDINGNPKKKWVNVGKFSDGIRESNAVNLRIEQLSIMKHGEDISIVSKKKKKEFISLDAIANIYFSEKRTAKKQQSKYTNHIKPFFGNKNIELISKEDIKKHRQALLDGTLSYPKEIANINNIIVGKKSPQTVNGIIDLIKAIYNYSIKEHDLKITNPCFGITKLKTDNSRERFLTSSEINLLMENLENNETLTIFTKLSLQTGGRLETILNIKKKDIDFDNNTVILKNLKTGNTYTGFLQSDFIEYLKEYLKNHRANDYVVRIFGQIEKTTSRQIQSRLKPILDRLFNFELDNNDRKNRVVIHTFRHTFASNLAINGAPIFTIKELMDHHDIEQTMRYAKLAPDFGKNFIEKLYF